MATANSPGFLPNQSASPVTTGSDGFSMSSRPELASSGSLFPSLSAAAHSWLLIYLLPPPPGLSCSLVGHLLLLLLLGPAPTLFASSQPVRARPPSSRRGTRGPEKAGDCCDAHTAFRLTLASRPAPPTIKMGMLAHGTPEAQNAMGRGGDIGLGLSANLWSFQSPTGR